jgi:hypothetical protein
MGRRVVIHLIGTTLVVLLASSVADADDKHHKGHGKGKHDTTADHRVERETYVIDRDGHRRIVTEYYTREGLPPGLARRESLPPGLAKHLRERGTLPPGLQKRLVAVPRPLADRLPPQPPYYRRYFAGRDLVIIDRRTNRVAAIIPNVLPG